MSVIKMFWEHGPQLTWIIPMAIKKRRFKRLILPLAKIAFHFYLFFMAILIWGTAVVTLDEWRVAKEAQKRAERPAQRPPYGVSVVREQIGEPTWWPLDGSVKKVDGIKVVPIARIFRSKDGDIEEKYEAVLSESGNDSAEERGGLMRFYGGSIPMQVQVIKTRDGSHIAMKFAPRPDL